MPPSKIFFLLWSVDQLSPVTSAGLVAHTFGAGHGIGDLFRLITGPRRAECLHTAALIELWHISGHKAALQTLYEYTVARISTRGKPCCIPGFISDPLEAFIGGVYLFPNIARMKKRINYSCPECKEYLVMVMETTCGVRHVPHVKNYFTTGNPVSSTHHHVHHTTTTLPPGTVTPDTQHINAECNHTGDLLKIWNNHRHYAALETIYLYIVEHISDQAMPCCIPGSYTSDVAEALFPLQLPNMARMVQRIRYSGPMCKEFLASKMEAKGMHRVPHVNHYYTVPQHVHTTVSATTKPTTTTPKPTTTTPAPTTPLPTTVTVQATTTNQNKTITGIVCPSCDMNLNCVWTDVCVPTQSCLVRSYPGYPFSTHCAEKGDCLLMKHLAPNGEIFCCDDENCIHNILGV